MSVMRSLFRFGKLICRFKCMKITTIAVGFLLIITTCIVLTSGLSESLMFANYVEIRWANNSSYTNQHFLPFTSASEHQTLVYGIVIDAGSTGTRIHVYKFVYRPQGKSHIPMYELVEEALEEVRPGLSSYSHDARLARDGIMRLMALARRRVPTSLTRFTHVTLRATAGLRLLSTSESESLLNESRECIRASGFIVDRVEIMDGLEEAVQAWVTVNYLLRRLHKPRQSMGIMDLGGASTQVTFVPIDPLTLSIVPTDHMHTLKLDGSSVDMYTHSYLGLGLMVARLSVLSSKGGLKGSSVLSPCVPHKYEGHWTHGGVRFSITSTARYNVSSFDECYRRSRILVTEQIPVVHSKELRQRDFYLFSYFYDRIKDAGVDLESSSPHQVTLDDYRRLAFNACSPGYARAYRKPFLCLDLVYIYALLKDGYQFELSSSFYLAKKINNIELGWALGVVFDLLYRTESV